MRVGIVLARVVVAVLLDGCVRDEALEEVVVILQEAGFIVVDVHTRADVHRIHETQAFFDSALLQSRFDLRRDVDVGTPGLRLECEFFPIRLHSSGISIPE